MSIDEFRVKFKKLLIIVIALCSLFFVLPNSTDVYYFEINASLLIVIVGAIFYISARRYIEIGGSRWNTFVAFVHFPEFLRLWWEEAPKAEPPTKQQGTP